LDALTRLIQGDDTVNTLDFDFTGQAGCGQEFFKYLMAIFKKKGLSEADAQEHTQETFIRVLEYQHRKGVSPDTPESMRALLASIARNLATDFHRKRNGRGKTKRPRVIPFSSFGKERAVVLENRLELDAATQKAQEAARREVLALLELKGGAKVVETVELLDGGYTTDKIAGLLNINVRTVKKRLRQAKEIISNARSASPVALAMPGASGTNNNTAGPQRGIQDDIGGSSDSLSEVHILAPASFS